MSTVAATTTTTTTAPSSALAFMSRSQSKKFPFKCHEMLAYAEKHGLEDIVSWLPGGKAFAVHDQQEFCKQVLKATFKHSNFKSFEKQLNNWGFKRSVSNENRSKAFSNPSFIRGRKSLCQTMTSKSTLKKAAEGTKNRPPSSSSQQAITATTTAAAAAAALSAARQQQQQHALAAAGLTLNAGMFFGNGQVGGGNNGVNAQSPSTTSVHDLQMMLLRHKQALLLQNLEQQRQREGRQLHQQQQQQFPPEIRDMTSIHTTTEQSQLLQPLQHTAAFPSSTPATTNSTNRFCGDESREEDKERAAVLLTLRRGV